MDLSQINEITEGVLFESNFKELRDFQKSLLQKLKTGKNLFFEADSNSGLRTMLQIYSIYKAPKAFEGSPRVLWIDASVSGVHKIVKELRDWTRRSEIAVEIADDKGKIVQQRNDIFEGADIIVGNPKRVLELYNQNGIHINQLQLFIVSDLAEICKKGSEIQGVRRIAESLPKCQKVISTKGKHSKINEFLEEVLGYFEHIAE